MSHLLWIPHPSMSLDGNVLIVSRLGTKTSLQKCVILDQWELRLGAWDPHETSWDTYYIMIGKLG